MNGEDVRLKKPVIYQERGGVREPVAGGYRILDAAKQQVGFQLGAYDRSRPLIIDPTIVFATYRGGVDHETPRRIEVNAIGEVYLFADSRDPSTLPRHHAAQTVPLAPPQPGFGQCFLTKLSPDGSTALYTVIFEGAQCQAMALGPEDRSDTRKIHLQVGTSYHYQRTLTESAANGLTLEPLQGAYDVCLTDQGSCGPVQWMRADANGDVYFIMSYTPLGMTPPDFVYELRKIDTQGQLVGAIRLIQPPIYASARRQLRSRSDYRPRAGPPRLRLRHRLRRVAGHHHADRERADVRPSRRATSVPIRCSAPATTGFVLKIDTTTPTFAIAYASYLGGTRRRSAVRPRLGCRVNVPLRHRHHETRANFPSTPGSSFPVPPQGGQKRVPDQAGSRRAPGATASVRNIPAATRRRSPLPSCPAA